MSTRTFEYQDDTYKAVITIHPATNYMGIQRQMMTSNAMNEIDVAQQQAKKENRTFVQDLAVNFAKTFQYPLLMSAASIDEFKVMGEDRTMDLEAFLALPGMLTNMWELAVYQANPHWQLNQSLERLEDIEKKARPLKAG